MWDRPATLKCLRSTVGQSYLNVDFEIVNSISRINFFQYYSTAKLSKERWVLKKILTGAEAASSCCTASQQPLVVVFIATNPLPVWFFSTECSCTPSSEVSSLEYVIFLECHRICRNRWCLCTNSAVQIGQLWK